MARIEWAFVEAFDSAERDAADARPDRDPRRRIRAWRCSRICNFSRSTIRPTNWFSALHEREKRQTSEAGVERETSRSSGKAAANCAGGPPGLPRTASISRSTIRRLRREEFLTLAAIRQGLPLAEALEAGLSFAHPADTPGPRRSGLDMG